MNALKEKEPRYTVLLVLTALLFLGTGGSLFYQQMIAAAPDAANANVRTYEIAVPGSRGEILDKNGNTFVYNEQIHTLVLSAVSFPADTEAGNREILAILNKLEGEEESWLDLIPLRLENGAPVFEEDREADVRWMRSKYFLELNSYATPQNCYDALTEKFKLEPFSPADRMRIASVRYGMARKGFSATVPYTLAEDVSVRTISYFKENAADFPGVDGAVTSARKYMGDGSAAAHVLGFVGGISEEEYSEKQAATAADLRAAAGDEKQMLTIEARRYLQTDIIGKSGLEQAMEPYLRGANGKAALQVDADGNVSETVTVPPEDGGTVVTTLDLKMQQIAERALADRIAAITAEKPLAGGLTPAGAVVVEDVKTGALLAAASYPGFSLATYFEDYADLASDPGKPLWNRAFQSGYSPGSTMKPATAVAGLEEGVITPDSTFYCSGVYQYIDQTFVCFNRNAHGTVNVKTALAESCNLFFFNVAQEVGIQKLNAYASLLGLGQKTGVEIPETEGIVAGYEYRESIGRGWKPGETLLAAIGQSDNSFSAVQLTNYCATIANGGTRYEPYLVSSVLSADRSELLYRRDPKVAVETNISKTTLDAVKAGMYLVANETSCKPYLGDLAQKVACKTGTAEKSRIIDGALVEGTDGFLIAFGPYDDPQIAITVVVENAGSGASTAQVAADIFEYYFSTLNYVQPVQPDNELL